MISKIRVSLKKGILKMKLNMPVCKPTCLRVSGHRSCFSFLPPGWRGEADPEKSHQGQSRCLQVEGEAP